MNNDAIKNMKPLTIGKVAMLAEVGVETVRFYERKGLVPQPPKKASGYRHYPDETVKRIRFIKRAKELGFSLKEISELLNLRTTPGASCADVRQKAIDKLGDVNVKIAELQRIRKALEELTTICTSQGSTSQCPILDTLDS